MTEHVDYPHPPGYLFDCAACEERCHCSDGSCVFHAEDNPHHCQHVGRSYRYGDADDSVGRVSTCERCGARVRLVGYGDGTGDPMFVVVDR